MSEKMAKISDNTHEYIIKAQDILLKKYKLNMRIEDIMSYVIDDPEEIVKKVISKIKEIEL